MGRLEGLKLVMRWSNIEILFSRYQVVLHRNLCYLLLLYVVFWRGSRTESHTIYVTARIVRNINTHVIQVKYSSENCAYCYVIGVY